MRVIRVIRKLLPLSQATITIQTVVAVIAAEEK
jgi:hypothetical protein